MAYDFQAIITVNGVEITPGYPALSGLTAGQYLRASGPTAVNFSALSFDDLTDLPTTLAGYGITDGLTESAADGLYSPLGHTHTFASLTSKPTSIAGYGITDAYTKTEVDGLIAAATVTSLPWSSITSTPTTLAGYGITDAAPAFGNQSANYVYAGPTSGSPAAPAFRALVAADIPNRLTTTYINPASTLVVSALGASADTSLWIGYEATGARTATLKLFTDDTWTAGSVLLWRVGATANADTRFDHRGTGAILFNAMDAGSLSFYSDSTEWWTIAASGATTLYGATLIDNSLQVNGAFTLSAKTANYVYAGPTAGGSAAPDFRALVAADIPNLPWSKITSGTPTTLAGYGITDALNSATTRAANLVYAGPSTGADAAPTFRALVVADIPSSIARTTGTPSNGGIAYFSSASGPITGSTDLWWSPSNLYFGINTGGNALAKLHVVANNVQGFRLSTNATTRGTTYMAYNNGSNGDAVYIASNAYYDGSNWQRIETGAVGWYIGMGGSSSDSFGVGRVASGANPISAWTSLLTVGSTGNVTAANNVYPGAQATHYVGLWSGNGIFVNNNLMVNNAIYPGNQSTHFIGLWSGSGINISTHLLVQGNIYPNNQASVYLYYSTYLRSSGDFMAQTWFRANPSGGTQGGLYWESYGGGLYMDDGNQVRVYGSKGFAAAGNSSFGFLTLPATTRLVARGASTTSSDYAFIAQSSTPANLLTIRDDGQCQSAQTFGLISDARVKHAIKPLAESDRRLHRLRPVRHAYNASPEAGARHFGFIAQEFAEVYPELVDEAATVETPPLPDGQPPLLAIRYGELIPALVYEIQQLQAEVESLKKKAGRP